MRHGLSEQTIVVTDPMELLRELDVKMADSRSSRPSICTFLTNDPRSEVAGKLRRFINDYLLLQSGVGTVESLVRTALTNEWGREGDLWVPCSVDTMIRRCGGSVRQVAKLATQSTALIAEDRGPDAVPMAEEAWAEAVSRFNDGPTRWSAKRRLRAIGASNIIFDDDNRLVTGMVEDVRVAAETTAKYDWLLDDYPQVGSVRTGDDARHVRLQIADVAVGWASSLIARSGYLAAATVFRLVYYNGERLTLEDAERLDRLQATHRRLIPAS